MRDGRGTTNELSCENEYCVDIVREILILLGFLLLNSRRAACHDAPNSRADPKSASVRPLSATNGERASNALARASNNDSAADTAAAAEAADEAEAEAEAEAEPEALAAKGRRDSGRRVSASSAEAEAS
jgi:hypothetical protein